MKIAVLGGTRFIGPFIVRGLVRQGHEVQVYHRGKTTCQLPESVGHVIVDRDIKGQTTSALAENRPDAVIDMCGYHREHVEEVVAAGLDLKHYVFCGTTAVYGQIGKSTPSETSPVNPKSSYELGKVACEKYLSEVQRERGFPVTVLRLAHPYGLGDHLLYTTGRESLFLDRIRRGRAVVIPGGGDTRVHPIYVEDAAEAFIHVLGSQDCVGRVFNLSGDEVLSLDEYFTSIARVLGKPLRAHHVPAEWFEANKHVWAGQNRGFDFGAVWPRYESAFDVTALRSTGFRCRTDHDQGVALTISWLDEQGLIPSSSDNDLEDTLHVNSGGAPEWQIQQ